MSARYERQNVTKAHALKPTNNTNNTFEKGKEFKVKVKVIYLLTEKSKCAITLFRKSYIQPTKNMHQEDRWLECIFKPTL
jgi:hypothetical protein